MTLKKKTSIDQYIALLRGINVGGKNIIKMTDLKLCFENLGFMDVVTYIQSGNVLFSSNEESIDKPNAKIERALSLNFKYKASVVLISKKQLAKVIKTAPKGFGLNPTKYRYDVLFLKEPLSSSEALEIIPTNPEVDRIYRGSGVVYYSRLIAKATQSRLSKLSSMPIYQSMTIRNWNTTKALHELMEKRD